MFPWAFLNIALRKRLGFRLSVSGRLYWEKRRVTADTDLHLCRYFRLTDGYWLRAQVAFDLRGREKADRTGTRQDRSCSAGYRTVVLKDDGGGAAMRRRRQSAVYSPGGCGCGLLLLPVIAVSIGVMFALAGLAAAALVLFITAIGVTIWLCRNREQRRADGKTNVGWVVFLIIAYLLSASYLVFFVLLMISAFTGESVTVG